MAGREFDLERHFQQKNYCQSTVPKDKQRIITKKRIESPLFRENAAKDTVSHRNNGHVSQTTVNFCPRQSPGHGHDQGNPGRSLTLTSAKQFCRIIFLEITITR